MIFTDLNQWTIIRYSHPPDKVFINSRMNTRVQGPCPIQTPVSLSYIFLPAIELRVPLGLVVVSFIDTGRLCLEKFNIEFT